MGLGPKVRYAVVALGDISQRAFMPSVKHTHNSELVALVSGYIIVSLLLFYGFNCSTETLKNAKSCVRSMTSRIHTATSSLGIC